MPLALTITPKGFEEAMKAMQTAGKNAQKAARDAIQRGLTTGRKIADQEIRQRYAIKSAAVKAEMTVKVAGLNGSVAAKGPNLPVSLFAPRVDRKRKMVTVEIIKGRRKPIGGAVFMAKGKVMERRQAERKPIFPVSTIGVPIMLGVDEIGPKVQAKIEEEVSRRMASNMQRALSGKAFQ